MPAKYTPGSFTKNFSWDRSYRRLHSAIRAGFGAGLAPVSREQWRDRSDIGDANQELIPLNFFLYSSRGQDEDYIPVDRLVERSLADYDSNFAKLALFTFHLSASGGWHHSKWPDGRVAGWANDLIRNIVWNDGRWRSDGFSERSLASFIEERIEGEGVTKRKVLTNYRYMLVSAGVLMGDALQPIELREPWAADSVMLFWDRQLFSGDLNRLSSQKDFETAFLRAEIYKLLGCTLEQGRAIARAAYAQYSVHLLPRRIDQLDKLKVLLAA